MTAPPGLRELRTAWSGTGPVNAAAWWIYADGSTSEHVWAVRPTKEEALDAVRTMAAQLIEGSDECQ